MEELATWRRWALIAVVALANVSASTAYLGFAAISQTASDWWQVSVTRIDQASIVGQAMPLLGYTVGMVFCDRLGYRKCFWAGLMITLVGVWLRFCGREQAAPGDDTNWDWVLAGQVLVAFSSPFLTVIAAPIAKGFFPPTEGALAEALVTLSLFLGIAVGQLLAGIFEDDIPLLILVEAVLSSVPVVIAPFLLPRLQRSGDPVPFSQYASAAIEIVTSPSSLRMLLGIGLVIGTFNSILTLIDTVLPESASGLSDVASILPFAFGIPGAIVMALVMDRTRAYTKILLVSCTILAPVWIICAICWHFDVGVVVVACFGLLGLLGIGLLPLCIELGVEMNHQDGFDVEAAVAGLTLNATNLFGIITYYISDALFEERNGGPLSRYELPWVWSVFFLVGLALLLSVRNPTLRRLDAERAAESEDEAGLLSQPLGSQPGEPKVKI